MESNGWDDGVLGQDFMDYSASDSVHTAWGLCIVWEVSVDVETLDTNLFVWIIGKLWHSCVNSLFSFVVMVADGISHGGDNDFSLFEESVDLGVILVVG